MPICCRCEADGVMEALGGWYCDEHLEDGLLDVAAYLSNARGWPVDDTVDQLTEWLTSGRS